GTFATFRNLRSPGAIPQFGSLDVGRASRPGLADLDGDGDPDLVSGDFYGGRFHYFENTGGVAAAAAFAPRTGPANPLDGQSAITGSPYPLYGSSAGLVDLDGDGDFDLVSGASDPDFRYFENTGTAAHPAFIRRTGTANPLAGLHIDSVSA